MQVNLHSTNGNQFTSYTTNSVTVNNQEYTKNIMVTPEDIINLELNDIANISIDFLENTFKNTPDIIIFGTGQSIKMPPLNVLAHLQKKHIGFEIMPIPALCRTYNYLIGEGRQVYAYILF